jgi:hypothetical protein
MLLLALVAVPVVAPKFNIDAALETKGESDPSSFKGGLVMGSK